MIVVTNIEYFEVKGEEHDFYRSFRQPYDLVKTVDRDGVVNPVPARYIIERIKGRRFRRRDQEWIVGLSNEVADIFQLQESAWETMEKELGFALDRAIQLNIDLQAAKNELETAKKAGWKTRLRWLFKGYSR